MAHPIFIYWHQGWDNAPDVVISCKDSWIKHHEGTEYFVVLLDSFTLTEWLSPESQEYIKLNFFLERLRNQTSAGSLAFFSDYLRVVLLSLHGGIWVDSTLFCLQPLCDWLPSPIQAGFPLSVSTDRLFEVWFIDNRSCDPLIFNWKHFLETPHFSQSHYTSFVNDWSTKKFQIEYWLFFISMRSWTLSAAVWNSYLSRTILRKRPYFMVNYALQRALIKKHHAASWYRYLLPIDYASMYSLLDFQNIPTANMGLEMLRKVPFLKLSHHMPYWTKENEHGFSLHSILHR